MSHIILAKAWNNGKFLPNGGGYGVWLTNYFKDEYLDVEWASVILELEGWEKVAELGIKRTSQRNHRQVADHKRKRNLGRRSGTGNLPAPSG